MADGMEKSALEYLVGLGDKLASPVEKEIDGRQYTTAKLSPVAIPLTTPLKIKTLQSLIELCDGKFTDAKVGFEQFDPKRHLIHVVDYNEVVVVTALSNTWKNREVLIECDLADTTPFTFGQFMSQEKFIIGLLSCFVDMPQRAALAKLAGNATAEQVATLVDDGITQMVSMRAGAAIEESKTIKGLVNLAPYRTFRDVEQPKSDFLFRVRKQGDAPEFGLYEADGGAWKLRAVENIARKLSAGLKTATVVS